MFKETQSHEYLDWLLEAFGVDHDGTVADSRTAVAQEFNKIYGTNYLGVDIFRWDTVVDWCLNLGMDETEAKHK